MFGKAVENWLGVIMSMKNDINGFFSCCYDDVIYRREASAFRRLFQKLNSTLFFSTSLPNISTYGILRGFGVLRPICVVRKLTFLRPDCRGFLVKIAPLE